MREMQIRFFFLTVIASRIFSYHSRTPGLLRSHGGSQVSLLPINIPRDLLVAGVCL